MVFCVVEIHFECGGDIMVSAHYLKSSRVGILQDDSIEKCILVRAKAGHGVGIFSMNPSFPQSSSQPSQ